MQKQLGLSLVELMISITLGLVLMIGVVQMFLSTKTTFNTQQSISRIQETGRLAIEFMSKDIRAAANYGCGKSDGSNSGKALQSGNLNMGAGAGLHSNFDVGIKGYDSTADLPNSNYVTNLGNLDIAEQNIISIHSALDVGMPVNRLNQNSAIYAYTEQTAVTNNCVDGICVGAAVVIGDCYGSRAFKVSSLAIDSTNELTIVPEDSFDTSIPNQQFKTGEVAPLKTVVYFIATGVNGAPSLWQRTNTAPAVEILEGVEQMNIRYALSNSIDTYSSATDIGTNWANVSSVRLELVVRSLNDNAVETPQPYVLNNVASPGTVTPTDKYMRQVFSTTINLRNRTF